MSDPLFDNKGVIVLLHDDRPFCYAARDEPVDEADSGWQFSAYAEGCDDAASAQIWTLSEVLDQQPTLRRFMALPHGTVLRRIGSGDEWQLVQD
jgi:hypothetical protein